MSEKEIKNAKIKRTLLGNEDHGIFTCRIYLDYGGLSQSFGDYALDQFNKDKNERVGTAFGLQFIKEILKVLEVKSWEDLPGTFLRVECDWGKVYRIGHFLKNQWFDPSKLCEEYK